MKQFTEPQLEILELDILDILTASISEVFDTDDLVGWNEYK